MPSIEMFSRQGQENRLWERERGGGFGSIRVNEQLHKLEVREVSSPEEVQKRGLLGLSPRIR
jgi:hypothetical protein